MDVLFKAGKHVVEYRFRKKDGSYCWVNDEQHLMLDSKGAPSESGVPHPQFPCLTIRLREPPSGV